MAMNASFAGMFAGIIAPLAKQDVDMTTIHEPVAQMSSHGSQLGRNAALKTKAA